MDLEKIRSGFEEFLEELERESCENRRGFKDELNTESIYKKFDWVYSTEALNIVKAALEKAEGDDERRLKFLLHELTGLYLSSIVAPMVDEMTTMESKATIEWGGKSLALRMVTLVMRDEPSQERRRELYKATENWRKKFSSRKEKIWSRIEEESRKLGYDGYLDLNSKLKGVDYEELVEIAKRLLRETEEVYVANVKRRLAEHNLVDFETFDAPYLMNDEDTKGKFPRERLVPMLKNFLSQMNISMDDQKNITWDLEQREKKVQRACMYPIKVPNEIYVLLQPSAGKNDAITLFHEAGHAEHYSHVDPDLPMEFKYLGLMSTAETWSYVLDHLFMNDDFMKEHTSLTEKEIDDMKDKMWFKEMLMLRRYAAKCIYEHKFWANDLKKLNDNWEPIDENYSDMGDCYATILKQATKSRYYPISHVLDMDSGFYAFEYFKAWLSEAQVRSFMERNFGMQWWKNEDAQKILKDLWSTGGKLTAEEIVQSLGYPALRTDELIAKLPKV